MLKHILKPCLQLLKWSKACGRWDVFNLKVASNQQIGVTRPAVMFICAKEWSHKQNGTIPRPFHSSCLMLKEPWDWFIHWPCQVKSVLCLRWYWFQREELVNLKGLGGRWVILTWRGDLPLLVKYSWHSSELPCGQIQFIFSLFSSSFCVCLFDDKGDNVGIVKVIMLPFYHERSPFILVFVRVPLCSM